MKNILRNFWLTLIRFKIASVLNILGLTVAFTVFIVIMSQTYWELTYNKGIKQHEKIFRLIRKDSEELKFVLPRPLGEAIGKSSPSIETYAAFTNRGNQLVKTLETNGQVKETQTSFVKVSSSVTDLLSLECLAGDFKRMEEPKTAIIAKSLADILFSDRDDSSVEWTRTVAYRMPLGMRTYLTSVAYLRHADFFHLPLFSTELSSLTGCTHPLVHRALPCAIEYKAFSLKTTKH